MSVEPALTPSTVARWSDGQLLQGEPDRRLSEVVTDSRGTLPEDALFVAIKGKHFDGHRFVQDAVSAGAAAALVSDPADIEYPDDVAVIQVDDTLAALQRLATRWRELFDIPVIAITGSNGKTIVKDMLGSILARGSTVHRSPGSYNSQIGVPLSLLGIRPEHDAAIIEAGISRVGEMERLERMIQPTHGILTNIGLAHAAGLKTLETTAREKLELFATLGDGPLVFPTQSDVLQQFDLPGNCVGFCVDCEPDDSNTPVFVAREVQRADGGFEFAMALPDGHQHDMQLNTPGRHNVANATAAVAMSRQLGVDISDAREGLAAFDLSPMRLEMHTTQAGVTLINDAYSSDPPSARAAISALEQYAGQQRKVAILGDMLDLGERSAAAHRDLGTVVARGSVDLLICYGERAGLIGDTAIASGMDDDRVMRATSMDELHDLLDQILSPGDFVLFKGSRTLGLERAAEHLLESVAPARLEVDLDAIRQNYHAIRRHVGEDTGFIAVVKSFGYGNDSTRVSQTLVREGVDALAVAYADEGIPLRRRGLELPILVTNALASEADKIVKYGLTPFVYSTRVVDALRAQARRRHATVPVHVEIDTGMNRVGIRPKDALSFIKTIDAYPEIEVEGLLTHFAAADDPDEDEFTAAQIRSFEGVIQTLADHGFEPELIHAANTSAAWRWPETRYGRVRVGLGLYGLSPSKAVASSADHIRPALSFTTQVIHLHDVEAGETVGYNRTWTAPESRRLATIAVGYNDGFPRFMSNGGEVLVNGQRCPVVGSVCMDVSMVDVSALTNISVGDEVVIFGEQGGAAISVDEIAGRGGTINYEILCNISPRVRRIFVRE
ncbi:MAG: alanine racemase [Myxococcota bacterium]